MDSARPWPRCSRHLGAAGPRPEGVPSIGTRTKVEPDRVSSLPKAKASEWEEWEMMTKDLKAGLNEGGQGLLIRFVGLPLLETLTRMFMSLMSMQYYHASNSGGS